MARCCGGTVAPTRDNPIIVGEPNGVTVRAKPTLTYRGVAAYQLAFWSGAGVAERVAAGVLVVVT